jgi:hypothetical protein
MQMPSDTSLPFFSYGIFRVGGIGFISVKEYINKVDKNKRAIGKLLVRDGIPILDTQEVSASTIGDIFYFTDAERDKAYGKIVDLEPEKYYSWVVQNIDGINVNLLSGVKAKNGSVVAENLFWDSWNDDALFTTAFEIIEEELERVGIKFVDGKRFLKLQMLYLLLWTSIERYLGLRYSFRGAEISSKIRSLSNNSNFAEMLIKYTEHSRYRKIYSTDRADDALRFDCHNAKKSLEYFYQVRCNITHRGKAALGDSDLVEQCLRDLYRVYKEFLNAEKRDAENTPFL